jgi:hypothetical protein
MAAPKANACERPLGTGLVAPNERAAAAGHVTYQPENAPATAELTEAGTDHFAALCAYARTGADVAF